MTNASTGRPLVSWFVTQKYRAYFEQGTISFAAVLAVQPPRHPTVLLVQPPRHPTQRPPRGEERVGKRGNGGQNARGAVRCFVRDAVRVYGGIDRLRARESRQQREHLAAHTDCREPQEPGRVGASTVGANGPARARANVPPRGATRSARAPPGRHRHRQVKFLR